MKIHFIAIGGAAMHNLAIALHLKGITVSGSDDEIVNPSRGRLKNHGLLPPKQGWDPNRITKSIDAIILGMHARKDNPELLRAKELGIKIYSYPEYVYEASKNKTRIVIAGSHGKTSITSMILHVLNSFEYDFDYLVGAQLEGFETMVKLTDAPIIVLEGDEYLSSPIDPRPKFSWYHPHIALITGIAWDHINVFPTFEKYVDQFRQFIGEIEKRGFLTYFKGDEILHQVCAEVDESIEVIPYDTPEYRVEDDGTYLMLNNKETKIQVFGAHNLQNLMGALTVCDQIGIDPKDFLSAISSFGGASKRLEPMLVKDDIIIYKDFAHSPSKLKATINACKEQYTKKKLLACMELHTFSSLNKAFLPEYAGTMEKADEKIVYYNPQTVKHKRLEAISVAEIKKAFKDKNIRVFTDSKELQAYILGKNWKGHVLLFMSSGNYDGIDLKDFSSKIAKKAI